MQYSFREEAKYLLLQLTSECTPTGNFKGNNDVFCDSIQGDATFENFEGKFGRPIKEITGCLSIINSDFNLNDVSFLKSTNFTNCKKWKIHNSKHMCWKEKEIEADFGGKEIDYIPHEECSNHNLLIKIVFLFRYTVR